MKRPVLRPCLLLLSVVLLILSLGASAAWAGPASVASDAIAVDADAYYKSLTAADVAPEVRAATKRAATELAAASLEADALAVGDVKPLYVEGDWQDFTLMALEDKAEIWVANDLSYAAGDPRPPDVVTQAQVDYLLDEFNTNIYPQTTTYFGFTADRDGYAGSFYTDDGFDWYLTDDPQRVMILVYNIVDEAYYDPEFPFYIAGYVWPAMNDEMADRNIIHIDSLDWANQIGADGAEPYAYEAVFTHEYEHVIHADHDADETAWVDEGLADLAPYLIGYGHSAGHIAYYLVYHRTPLTVWGGGLEDYGASYLFQLYLLENFGGPEFVKNLVDEQDNGIAGIEDQLVAMGFEADFDEVYRDWTVANLLDDTGRTGLSGAQLGYAGLDIPSDDTWGYSIQWSVKNLYGADNRGNLPLTRYWGGYKSGTVEYPVGDLMPYGPMYKTYAGFSPELIANLRGNNTTGVAAHSGTYELWGGRADLAFNTATLAAPLFLGDGGTLRFWANYQIEEFWDFGFVQISTDGGSTWTSLANANTTSEHDPQAHPDVIASLPGFTGSSGGWVEQTFDLSAYAGQSVLLRFLYVTDWGYVDPGFYVDEITVNDESGVLLSDDLEAGAGAWTVDGWQHTTGLATNHWSMTLVNPSWERGSYAGIAFLDPPAILDAAEEFQRATATLDTSLLNRGEVTVIVSNRLPEETSFPAGYLLLVQKGNAKKK